MFEKKTMNSAFVLCLSRVKASSAFGSKAEITKIRSPLTAYTGQIAFGTYIIKFLIQCLRNLVCNIL